MVAWREQRDEHVSPSSTIMSQRALRFQLAWKERSSDSRRQVYILGRSKAGDRIISEALCID